MKTKIAEISARFIFNIVVAVMLLLVGVVFLVVVRYFENAIWTILNINVIDNPVFFKIYSAIQGVIGLGIGILIGLRIKYANGRTLVWNLIATWRDAFFSGVAVGIGFSGVHHLMLLLATDAFIKAWK